MIYESWDSERMREVGLWDSNSCQVDVRHHKASEGEGKPDLQRTKCRSLQKACCQPLYQPYLKGSIQKSCEER